MQALRMSHTDAIKQPEAQAQPGAGPSLHVSKATASVGGQWAGNGDPCGRQCVRALSGAEMQQTKSTPGPSGEEKAQLFVV